MSAARKTTDDDAVAKEMVILNKLGVHARPSAMFVKTASRFTCDIFVEKDGEEVNGKSIMGMMMLAAGPGSRIRVRACGGDAQQAIVELDNLIQKKFGEE